MVILVTCKNEEDSIKNKGTIVITPLFIDFDFSDAQGQLDRILTKFKLIQAFMVVLVTCKNEEPSKY